MNPMEFDLGDVGAYKGPITSGDDAPEKIVPLPTAAARIATRAKELHDELVEKFGDDFKVMDMVIAAIPSISEDVYRTLRPRIVFGDTAESIEESLKIDDDYVPTSRGTTDAEERKKSIQAIVNDIFKRTPSDRRKGTKGRFRV